jgi:hypothetical protein
MEWRAYLGEREGSACIEGACSTSLQWNLVEVSRSLLQITLAAHQEPTNLDRVTCWGTRAAQPAHYVIFDRRHAAMSLADDCPVASHEQLGFIFILRLAHATDRPPHATTIHTEAISPVSLHLLVLRAPLVSFVVCPNRDYERALSVRLARARRIWLARRWWRGWRRRR